MEKNEELNEVFSEDALKILNNAEVKISELTENFGNVTLVGKVMHLFDQTHDKISQSGLVGDETGVTRFVIWKSDLKKNAVEVDKVYEFKNYKVNAYEEKISIVSDKNSITEKKNIEITVHETQSETTSLTAFVVDVKKAAITKLCDNPLDDKCAKKTKWGFDVRLVLDSGTSTVTVDVRDFDLLDLTIKAVKEKVMQSGDPSHLINLISDKIGGRYLQVAREYDAQRYFLISNDQLKKMVI